LERFERRLDMQMDGSQIEYYTAKTHKVELLDIIVNDKLGWDYEKDDGIWKLWGSPYIDKEGNICQALVKIGS